MYKINENTIDFAWKVSDIFDSVAERSVYSLQGNEVAVDDTLLPRFVLTSDEMPFFLSALRQEFQRLFSFYIKVSSPDDSSFLFNDVSALWGEEAGALCGFSIVRKRRRPSSELNPLRFKRADYFSQQCLWQGVAAQWALMCKNDDEATLLATMNKQSIESLWQALHYLKEYSYNKSYVIIQN